MCHLWVEQGNVPKGLKTCLWPHNKLVLIKCVQITSFKMKIFVESSSLWEWKYKEKRVMLKLFHAIICIEQFTLVRFKNLLKKNLYTHARTRIFFFKWFLIKSGSALESANWSENRVIPFSEMFSVPCKGKKIGENS